MAGVTPGVHARHPHPVREKERKEKKEKEEKTRRQQKKREKREVTMSMAREIRRLDPSHIDAYTDIAFNAYPSFKDFSAQGQIGRAHV